MLCEIRAKTKLFPHHYKITQTLQNSTALIEESKGLDFTAKNSKRQPITSISWRFFIPIRIFFCNNLRNFAKLLGNL